ncbi:MAG: DsrE family protein [Nitrospirae bacterium]|nr:DsrE family protein [Nitrospirota bacterium]
MEKKKLGVLLSTPPSHPSVTTVARLCQEAYSANVDVYLYLIDEGVLSLRDTRFLQLSASGVKFFVCAYGCQRHHVPTDHLEKEITLCGLVVLSNIINGCDRFVAFN